MSIFSDVKILDLTERLTGPLATLYLKKYGAEVIKIENPAALDPARKWDPIVDNRSIYFDYLNGGKKSVTLDIAAEAGNAVFRKLAAAADVVVVDKAPGYMESIGLGYETLKALNGKLIYASVTPYGLTGPMKNKPASSITIQARGVAMDMTGVINEPPVIPGPTVMEHYAAGYLATGIIMALIDRVDTGEGQLLDISLQDSIYSCIEAAPAAYSSIGEIHSRKGNFDPSIAPYDTFETMDGFVAVGCSTELQWQKLCAAMEFDDLAANERFKKSPGRIIDYFEVLRPLLAEKFIKFTKKEVEDRCSKSGVPCCAVLTIKEVTDFAETRINGFVLEKDGVVYPAFPFKLSSGAPEPFEKAAEAGSDNDKYITE